MAKEGPNYQVTSKALTASDENLVREVPVRTCPTEKERVENWFIGPLQKLGGDDAIVCLMVVMPLLEKILRHDLRIPDNEYLTLSDRSPALKHLAKLLSIPESQARQFWDCFRNGLMHRAMIKSDIAYILDADRAIGLSVKFENECVRVYIWNLRDLIITLLRKRGKGMWKDENHPLPGVF